MHRTTLALFLAACGGDNDCRDCQQRVAALEAELAELRATTDEPTEPTPETEIGASEQEAAPVAPASLWQRRESEDELTGRPIVMRTAQSREPFTLGSPYQGLQHATLTLREHPQHGSDVMIGVERGQLLCDFRGCNVNIVFDRAEPVRWRANQAAAGISTTLFLRNHDRFVRRLERAQEVRIAVSIYREGTRTFVFPGLSDEAPAPDQDEATE